MRFFGKLSAVRDSAMFISQFPLLKQKADNQMEWVWQMNPCKAQAEAIVKFELIYD